MSTTTIRQFGENITTWTMDRLNRELQRYDRLIPETEDLDQRNRLWIKRDIMKDEVTTRVRLLQPPLGESQD